jgi:hydrogenase expression/formation protein HypC
MCVGDPMRLASLTGIAGTTEEGEVIDLSLTPDAKPGDWLLVFLGTAREVLAEDEALKIRAALTGLRALMQGGDLGTAFADLEARTPALPPHLQAALDAGQTTG